MLTLKTYLFLLKYFVYKYDMIPQSKRKYITCDDLMFYTSWL